MSPLMSETVQYKAIVTVDRKSLVSNRTVSLLMTLSDFKNESSRGQISGMDLPTFARTV